MAVPKRVADRISSVLKTFQGILAQQKDRDVSEADTVTVVKDILSDLFGYDKYAELTSEHSIRGTYCDLAVKIDGKLAFLIEVKAIGLELKDAHIKQAIDYAANQGCEWVVLTNGREWRLYHVLFKKPIDKQEVATVAIPSASARNDRDVELLYLFTREGFTKNAMTEYRDRKDATSRFMLAATILGSDAVLSTIRRELRRVTDVMVDQAVVEKMLREEVIKRETIEGDQADAARRRVDRGADRSVKKAAGEDAPASSSAAEPSQPVA